MDSSLTARAYIPPTKPTTVPRLPDRHPSLIMADGHQDPRAVATCGCLGAKCIKEEGWWYGKDGEVKPRRSGDWGEYVLRESKMEGGRGV